MEYVIIFFIIVMVIVVSLQQKPNPPKLIAKPPKRVKAITMVKYKPKKKAKIKKEKIDKDPTVNDAKKSLVSLGFSATEAKHLLSGITASSVEDYVNQAMRKVKI